MKMLRLIVLTAFIFSISIFSIFSSTVNFVPAAISAEVVADSEGLTGEVMGMMKETILINKRLQHSPSDEDKARISMMMTRLDEIEAILEGAGDGRARLVREVAAMLGDSIGMTKKVIHAYPQADKERLVEMKDRLNRLMIEHNTMILREGRTGGVDSVIQDMMGMMDEIMDVMLDMKHTFTTRAEKARLDDMAVRMDRIIGDYGQVCMIEVC